MPPSRRATGRSRGNTSFRSRSGGRGRGRSRLRGSNRVATEPRSSLQQVIAILRHREQFVRQKIHDKKIPNGAQLADFIKRLVEEIWPKCPQQTRVVLREGFKSIGWNAVTNKASTPTAPSVTAVALFLTKALQRLETGDVSTTLSKGSSAATGLSLLNVLESRVQFVRAKLALGKIPNGPQLAAFLRQLVIEALPTAENESQAKKNAFESGLLNGVGWNAQTNRPSTASPPTAAELLSCLTEIVTNIRAMNSGKPTYAPSTSQPQTGPPLQPLVTSAGVKIFPNAAFNMDDYTTKLDTNALSAQQIREAEEIARQIESEKAGFRTTSWDDEGDSGMVSWE